MTVGRGGNTLGSTVEVSELNVETGTAGQVPKVNAAGDAVEWGDVKPTLTEAITSHSAAVANVWEDWDLSALVASGHTIAYIVVHAANGSSGVMGVRENGSALTRSFTIIGGDQMLLPVNIATSKTVEVYTAHTGHKFWLVGSF